MGRIETGVRVSVSFQKNLAGFCPTVARRGFTTQGVCQGALTSYQLTMTQSQGGGLTGQVPGPYKELYVNDNDHRLCGQGQALSEIHGLQCELLRHDEQETCWKTHTRF